MWHMVSQPPSCLGTTPRNEEWSDGSGGMVRNPSTGRVSHRGLLQ